MKLRGLLTISHQILSDAKIPHALIGGFALSALGVTRATNDIDYLVDGDFQTQTAEAFVRNGFKVFYQSSEVVQFVGPGPVDILFANRPLSKAMLSRNSGLDVLGIPSLDAADIIGLKIQAYCNNKKRELQDLADIQKLIEHNANLDWSRVEQYANIFGQWARIKALRGSP